MIGSQNQYVLLISSLPPHKRDLFAKEQTPISPIKLKKRLQWLTPADAEDLSKVDKLLYWSSMENETDRDFVENSKYWLDTIENAFLKRMILWRLEMRTIVAALRRRHLQMTPQDDAEILGFGRWPLLIVNHWELPDFGIGRQMPWVTTAAKLINEEDSLGLELFLLNQVWQQYERQGAGHYFDFEAVVIYVLRWDVLQRWKLVNRQRALERFNAIVEHCMQQVEYG